MTISHQPHLGVVSVLQLSAVGSNGLELVDRQILFLLPFLSFLDILLNELLQGNDTMVSGYMVTADTWCYQNDSTI